MQVKLQIKASILLGLFCLMLLHQMIPHLHHEHQEEYDHGVAEHGHSHEHKHKGESKDSQDFFSILMAMHSHGGSNSEVPVVENTIDHVSIKKVKTEKSSPQICLPKNIIFEDLAAELIRSYQPPPKYFNPYLSHLSLRGPPQMV